MVSDLTPEETLHDASFLGPDDEAAHVPLDVALAAVAAERERLGERLLSDEAVREACAAEASDWLTGQSRRDRVTSALSAAWRVVTGSKDGSDQ